MEQARPRSKGSKVKTKNKKNRESVEVVNEEDEPSDLFIHTDVQDDNEVPSGETCSAVVPGEFYQLCTPKRTLSHDDNQPIVTHQNNFEEPTAPPELQEEPETPTGPSAPLFEGNTQESFDDYELQDEELDSPSLPPVENNAVLPLSDDSWDMLGENIETMYPSLPQEGSIEDTEITNCLKPMTMDQLSTLYHNMLLEHGDVYTDQFLGESNNFDELFKTLLYNYYQAYRRLLQCQSDVEQQNKTVEKLAGKVFVTEIGEVRAEVYCQDERKVSRVHRFETCRYDDDAASSLASSLSEARRTVSEELNSLTFTSSMAFLRCEQHLFDVVQRFKHHRKRLQDNSGEVEPSILLHLVDTSVAEMKQVANVLFSFIRRKLPLEGNKKFWNDVTRWLSLIISHLVESSDESKLPGRHFSEEMFVLNHMLRCPPGVYVWMEGLVQISGPTCHPHNQDKTSLDHSIFLLHLLLRHPASREAFLAEYKAAVEDLGERPNSGWTMIDDEGEETDSLTNSAILPLESDLILMFRQVPMTTILAHALHITFNTDGGYEHPSHLSSEQVMTGIAICDMLCEILGEGLATLGRPKYKQLVRRIAQSIRNTVLLVAEQWLIYKNNPATSDQMYSMERLQLEYDEFSKRCVSRLLSVARLGVYQFIADLSYHTMSSRAAETIYLLMNVPPGVRREVDSLIATEYTKAEWLEFINDPDTKLAFEEQLSTMPTNEIVYLLTAFANLAQARPATEQHLVSTIAVDIFKVSFTYRSTRDICSKTGRELLSSITFYHPYVISTLLQYVYVNIDLVMSSVLYALNDLPFSSWQPTPHDLDILRNWLLGNSITSTEFKIAKLAIQGLNFGYKDGHLFLPLEVHYKISMLILETNVMLEKERMKSGIVLKSMDHVSKVASAVHLAPQSMDHKMAAWSWEIVLRLKLHQLVQCDPRRRSNDPTPLSPTQPRVPDINTDTSLVLLLESTRSHHSMASYIAIAMTTIGHSKDAFLHEGLELLHHLATSGHLRAVVSCLYLTVPMFQMANINLAENQRFVETLKTILHQNSGVISGITNLLVQEQKQPSIVHLLSAIVHNHMLEVKDEEDRIRILIYWLRMVLTVNDWFKDNALCSLVNYLFKSANQLGDKAVLEFRTMFYEHFIHLMLHSHHGNHGHQKSVVSSLLSMVTGGNHPTTLLSSNITGDVIYFVFTCVEAETRFEDDCKLWSTVIMTLRGDPKISVESAVKKANSNLKLSHNPSYLSLAIYRWGELALQTPYCHPLLELIWFNFFLRFVSFPLDGASSFGYRFFESVVMLPMYNKLRSRLQSTSEYQHGVVSSGRARPGMKGMHERLIKLYHTFKLWLEEPKIHESNLYLPSLPPQYNPDLLAKLRTRRLNLKLNPVHVERITLELEDLAESWRNLQNPAPQLSRKYTRYSFHRKESSTPNHRSRMNQLLSQFEPPLPLPTIPGSLSLPVVVSDVASLSNFEAVKEAVDQDIKVAGQFATNHVSMVAKHKGMDQEYLATLPKLYFLKEVDLLMNIECQSSYAPNHKCAGPGQIELNFREKTTNEAIAAKISSNRKKYSNSMREFCDVDFCSELCYASLHLESVIKALENNLKKPTFSQDLKSSIFNSGCKLFYMLAELYSGERKSCNPVKQVVSNCVEMLGQSFIAQSPLEARSILEQILITPSSSLLLSPHFAPGSGKSTNHTEEYVEMYNTVVRVVSTTTSDEPDVLFVLLTKFEMSSWLLAVNPHVNDLVNLMKYVVIGLIGCIMKSRKYHDSSEPLSNAITHKPSHAAVHAIYLNHLRSLLSYRFPQLLVDVLHHLLEASRTHDVTAECWKSLVSVSFEDSISSPSGGKYSAQIDWNTLEKSMQLLTEYFREARLSARKASLYEHWAPYTPELSQIFEYFCRTLLIFTQRDQIPLIFTETRLTEDPQWTPLRLVFDIFEPWVQPITDQESGEPCWPWLQSHHDSAEIMIESWQKILQEFSKGDNRTVSQRLGHIWSYYSVLTIRTDGVMPAYIFDAYHASMATLQWELFLPEIEALSQMVQICDINAESQMSFLCRVVPKIPWKIILEMCRVSDPSMTNEEISADSHDSWIPITGEILCRLLHVLFALGSDVERMNNHPTLKDLFNEVEIFPWSCISCEQIEYLATLVSDRFSWSSVLLPPPGDKKTLSDPRNVAMRLLKVTCRLLLVGEEKRSNGQPTPPTSPPTNDPAEWVKRQSFIRCVGRLLRKFKSTDTVVTAMVARLTERTMESIEMTSSGDPGESDHLTALVSVFFDFLNFLPMTLHDTVMSSIVDMLSRKFVCPACGESPKPPEFCQDCVYLQSRCFSSATLLSCISATCNTVTCAGYATRIIEAAIQSFLDASCAKSHDHDDVWSWWENVIAAYTTPVTSHQEFTKESLIHGNFLSLHVDSMSRLTLPGFYGNEDLSAYTDDSAEREKLNDSALADACLLSSWQPTDDNSSKLFLIWDHFLHVCSLLIRMVGINPQPGFTVHSVADTVASILPSLEQIGQDKVKTGILGSIGISRQSPVYMEIRLTAKALSVFIKQLIARIDPQSDGVLHQADKAFEGFRNLPVTHKSYQPFSTTVEDCCLMMSSGNSPSHRKFLSIFVSRFYQSESHLKHIVI